MASGDKLSFRVFESVRDQYVVPFLCAAGFKAARKGQYEQLRDDTLNRVILTGATDRRGDVCYVDVNLAIGYRQIGELIAEHLGDRSKGLDSATRTVKLSTITPASGTWDQGLDNPNDWRNLLPEKDPAILGPILVELLRRFAIPFFEARSSLRFILDSSKPESEDAEIARHLFLKPAALYLTGSHAAAIDLLKAREAEFDEDFRVKGLLRCGEFLKQARDFRLFLENRDSK
jgi:hypothetical protein